MTTRRRHTRHAFTLIELLMVISIIMLIIGITFPTVMMLVRTTRATTGVNTITVASSAARAYANRPPSVTGDLSTLITGADYSGTAILFCPSRDIRLLENSQVAKDTDGNYLEDLAAQGNKELNGFIDLSGRDYIRLPKSTGVVGINRTNDSGAKLVLLSPPFAVRFDQYGQLLAGDIRSTGPKADWVHYDGNYDSEFDLTSVRPTTYNPNEYDPAHDDYNASLWDAAQEKFKVPFEVIEPVIGVVVFDRDEFHEAGFTGMESKYLVADSGFPASPSDSELAAKWILEHGEYFFFNRYTGAVIRDWKPLVKNWKNEKKTP